MYKSPPTWLSLAIIVLLLVATAGAPHGYYQLLRLTVSAYAGWMAWRCHRDARGPWAWAFGLVLLINNPVWPIVMHEDTHAIFDLLSAGVVFGELIRRARAEDNEAARSRRRKWRRAAAAAVGVLGLGAVAVGGLVYRAAQQRQAQEQQRAEDEARAQAADAAARAKIVVSVPRPAEECLQGYDRAYLGRGLIVAITNTAHAAATQTLFELTPTQKGHSLPAQTIMGSTDLIVNPGKTQEICVGMGNDQPLALQEHPEDFDFTARVGKVVWGQ
jgi:hypothetical protein